MELGILNVGAGDTKISFDPAKPAEVKRASKIVTDMMKRGYVILVEVGHDDEGPLYRKVHKFDAKTAEYIIAGDVPEEEGKNVQPKPAPRRQGRKAKTETRIPAAKARGVAVSRTAGG